MPDPGNIPAPRSFHALMRAEDDRMQQSARCLDSRHISPLRRGPLSRRTKEPRMPSRVRTGLLVRLVVSVVVLAGVAWAVSL